MNGNLLNADNHIVDHYYALLADYAAGNLDEAHNLMMACYATYSAEAREVLYDLETIGGALLCAEEPYSMMSNNSLQSVLDKINTQDISDDSSPIWTNMPTAPSKEGAKNWRNIAHKDVFLPDCCSLPSPMHSCVSYNGSTASLRWKKAMKGIYYVSLPVSGGSIARLIKIDPGTVIPDHTHEGSELTLVLDGAFSDEHGDYVTGSLAIGHPDHHHQPIACPDQGCICLQVSSHPIKLTGWVGKLLNPFIRF